MLDACGLEGSFGRFRHPLKGFEGPQGSRALDAEESVMGGGIHPLNIVGEKESFQTRTHRGGESGFEVEQELVFESENVDVGEHFGLRVHESRVTTLPGLQILDIIGDLAMQKLGAVRSEEHESVSVGQVDPAAGFAEEPVFPGGIAVGLDGLETLAIQESCAQSGVDFVQQKRRHGLTLSQGVGAANRIPFPRVSDCHIKRTP